MPMAAQIDWLSGHFLQDGAEILSSPISEIYNLSISHEVFTDICKVAKLNLIYKKIKKTDSSNYRPISILPFISKVTERIVHDQTNKFLSDNDILYNFQSKFRPNYSKICVWHI